jgi:hypothetical protein
LALVVALVALSRPAATRRRLVWISPPGLVCLIQAGGMLGVERVAISRS